MIEKIVQIWDRYWMLFMQGLGVTLLLSLVIVIVGTLLGFLLAMLRLSNWKIVKIRPLNTLAGIYVEIVRGTPMLLQLYFFYFMLPMAFPSMNLSPIVCCAVALCLNSAAYVSEVIRSGIQAVDKGQMEAARSLGLNHRQAMVKVILPQAIKNIMPALGNEFIMMIKDTSLASTFFVGELMTVWQTVRGVLYLSLEPLIIVGCIYFIVTFSLSKGINFMERRMWANER